jgi:hypothetical protein
MSAYDPKLTSGGAAPRYHIPKSGNEWTVAALAGRRTLNSCRKAANWSSAGFCPCSLTGLHSRAKFGENFGKPPRRGTRVDSGDRSQFRVGDARKTVHGLQHAMIG